MTKGKLGILGGMGPQATLTFCQRVLDHTAASGDQEHIPALILNDTQIPDRTAAILSGDTGGLYARLLADARVLAGWGAGCIAIPCNTAHALVPRLQGELDVPIVNMIEEAAKELKGLGVGRAGILATDGTVQMGLYQGACGRAGMEAVVPPPEMQTQVMELIYGEVKRGKRAGGVDFGAIDAFFRTQGCDRVVLGCTELSVYRDWHRLPPFYVDAMDVLARRCVELCGYPLAQG